MPLPQEMPMPSMDNTFDGGLPPQDGTPPMGSEYGMDEMPNQFDTNFDPGVEANEEEDPKKFIQQLTGKLSQSLKNYNDNNGQPDVDLSKYVVGMIAKQAMKGLSQEDADDIIDKVKADEDFSAEQNADEQQPPMDNGQMPNDLQNTEMPQQMPQQPNECVSRNRKPISEIANGVLDNKEETQLHQTPKADRNSFRKKPFTSPNFEN